MLCLNLLQRLDHSLNDWERPPVSRLTARVDKEHLHSTFLSASTTVQISSMLIAIPLGR